jgi:uridine phosphorylase
MNHHDVPLLEHDPAHRAVIEPWAPRTEIDVPVRAVACWFGDVVARRCAGHVPAFSIALEREHHPVHVVEHRGVPVVLFFPGVGAPLAAASLELVIASGVRYVIGCGGAGIVVPGFDPGHVIVPTEAVRDEGTSYHYLPAGKVARPHPQAVAAIDEALAAGGVPHDRGRTWTTDAFFRETPDRVARRRDQGCLTVEMEAAAMFAVAAHRDVVYGQLLYAGDDVSAESWDHRNWNTNTTARDRLLDLALDAAIGLGS